MSGKITYSVDCKFQTRTRLSRPNVMIQTLWLAWYGFKSGRGQRICLAHSRCVRGSSDNKKMVKGARSIWSHSLSYVGFENLCVSCWKIGQCLFSSIIKTGRLRISENFVTTAINTNKSISHKSFLRVNVVHSTRFLIKRTTRLTFFIDSYDFCFTLNLWSFFLCTVNSFKGCTRALIFHPIFVVNLSILTSNIYIPPSLFSLNI